MWKIGIQDFLPPLFHRAVRFADRKINPKPITPLRIHPFDALPLNVNPKWIMDVGANEGHVADAALQTYAGSNIICFEPVKHTFDILKEKLAPYTGRTHLYNLALSEENMRGEINITSFHGANSILPQAMFHQVLNPHVREISKEEIQLIRLDDFASSLPATEIDILKIDVEGYELNVLKGGIDFISNNVDVIIIEISLMRDESWENQGIFDIFALLNKCGFRLINITDLYYSDRAGDENMMLIQMDCVFRKKSKLA
ncbi:MAG: FkbM family methyltransferase [Pseudomonadota bacterium]